MSTPLPTAVFALLALLPAVRVVAQATPPTQPADAAAAPAVATPTTPPAAAAGVAAKPEDATSPGTATKIQDASGRDTLTVDFPDEDIRNILRNVADLFELNIIMPDTLQGKTTIKLEWVPIDPTDVERRTFDEGRGDMTQGWTGTFEKLEEYLRG